MNNEQNNEQPEQPEKPAKDIKIKTEPTPEKSFIASKIEAIKSFFAFQVEKLKGTLKDASQKDAGSLARKMLRPSGTFLILLCIVAVFSHNYEGMKAEVAQAKVTAKRDQKTLEDAAVSLKKAGDLLQKMDKVLVESKATNQVQAKALVAAQAKVKPKGLSRVPISVAEGFWGYQSLQNRSEYALDLTIDNDGDVTKLVMAPGDSVSLGGYFLGRAVVSAPGYRTAIVSWNSSGSRIRSAAQ
jgi:hypothetical protein